MHGRVLS